jgi:hypothetical protein
MANENSGTTVTAASKRKEAIAAAIKNETNVAMAEIVADVVNDALEDGAKITTIDLAAITRLAQVKLEQYSRIKRQSGGRVRISKYVAARTEIAHGSPVIAIVGGVEKHGLFLGWAKGARGDKGFARVAFADESLATARISLPEKVEPVVGSEIVAGA